MSDPRNVAHAKKVTQEKKHHGGAIVRDEAAFVQPGRKSAAPKKKRDPAGVAAAMPSAAAAGESGPPSDTPTSKSPAVLEGLSAVLAKLREMESHSRANLERLAAMVMTVEDELKQTDLAGPLGDVYSAQNVFQTQVTALIDKCKTECDRISKIT